MTWWVLLKWPIVLEPAVGDIVHGCFIAFSSQVFTQYILLKEPRGAGENFGLMSL